MLNISARHQVPGLVSQPGVTPLESQGFMKHGCAPLFRPVRLFALAAALSLAAAHADEYSDVSQLLRAGKLAEAQARVDRHLAAKPRDPQMRFMKGVIQRDTGRLADAIITFTRLSEDYPELPEPYNNLATIYASQGQYEKARIALEKALHTNPSYATAHDNLSDIYAKLASHAYNKALQIGNADTDAQPKLALIRELSNSASAGQRVTTPAPTVQAAVTPPAPTMAATPAKPPAPMPPATAAAKPVVTATAQPAPASSVAPAAAPKAAATPQVAPADGPAREVEAAVRAWAKAWADKNMGGYLGAYGQEFAPPGQLSRSAWEQERRLRISGKTRISVSLLNLSVTTNGNRAVAKFQQDYKADSLAVLSRKTLELVKTGDRWVIVKETSGA
jgi:tetratricopeptide (TPR) repeat protein